MPAYSSEDMKHINSELEDWLERAGKLRENFTIRHFKVPRASEYARHGLSRRIDHVTHSVVRIFELIPLESDETPTRMMLHDATAFLHSFIVNVWGGIDNMARIYCLEADIRGANNEPILDSHIGLTPKNTTVRKSLSQSMRNYLAKSDGWFEYFTPFRHAVAHRIPVYIPPKVMGDDDVIKYRETEAQILTALKAHDFDEFERLFELQGSLGVFRPVMTHSYGEPATPMWMHAQIVCDLAILIEMGERMLAELDLIGS